nr:unnamed protein product [Callosobruchus chinensis]
MERYTPPERGIIVSMFLTNNRRSLVLAQCAFRRRFPNRVAPTGQTFRRLAARIEETRTTKDLAGRGRHREYRGCGWRCCCAPRNINQTAGHAIGHHQTNPTANFYVNKQNLRIRGIENLRVMDEKPLHPLKATVWCGVHAGGVIEPDFFEDAVGHTVTVTSERYIAMINYFLISELEERGLVNMWFQQDGATARTARATMDIVKELFPGRLISRFGDLAWPAKSPDLTAPDFFLCGYLKSRVYVNNPQTIAALEENIRQECEQISPEILRKVMENAIKRAQMYQHWRQPLDGYNLFHLQNKL